MNSVKFERIAITPSRGPRGGVRYFAAHWADGDWDRSDPICPRRKEASCLIAAALRHARGERVVIAVYDDDNHGVRPIAEAEFRLRNGRYEAAR